LLNGLSLAHNIKFETMNKFSNQQIIIAAISLIGTDIAVENTKILLEIFQPIDRKFCLYQVAYTSVPFRKYFGPRETILFY
jgi:hypothetical protein